MNIELKFTDRRIKSGDRSYNLSRIEFLHKYFRMLNLIKNDLSDSEINFLIEVLLLDDFTIRRGTLKNISDKLNVKPSFVTFVKNGLVDKGYLIQQGRLWKVIPPFQKIGTVIKTEALEEIDINWKFKIQE